MFFLLIFFWIRFSFGDPTDSMPTKVPTFQHIFDGILTHVYAKLFLNQGPNLVQISGKVFSPLANLFLVLCSQFGGTSTSVALIQTTESTRFPGIKPMINGHTIDLKNLLKLCCCIAF